MVLKLCIVLQFAELLQKFVTDWKCLIFVVCTCKNWDHLLTAWNSLIQITHFGIFYSILDDFDDEDLRFNDYENRLEDSFFKYVARTDDYDRNEVPWESHEPRKPVQVKMSAYLRYESTIFIISMQQFLRFWNLDKF